MEKRNGRCDCACTLCKDAELIETSNGRMKEYEAWACRTLKTLEGLRDRVSCGGES